VALAFENSAQALSMCATTQESLNQVRIPPVPIDHDPPQRRLRGSQRDLSTALMFCRPWSRCS